MRERIERGALPIVLVRALDAGYGHDGPCRACGETVLKTQIEHEVHGTSAGKLTLHLTCYALWQLECAEHIRNEEPNSPSARMSAKP